MDSHGQLIVLQFGTVSNWTGAHFWNLQDELHGLADQGDAACASFDGRVLYDESSTSSSATKNAASSSSSSSSSLFTPRLLSFDEPDALGPGLFSTSSSLSSSSSALDDGVALSASAATWGGRAVSACSGTSSSSPSSRFALALAEREERERRRRRRRRRRQRSSAAAANDDDDDSESDEEEEDEELAAAASALSLSGGVSTWADFLKAPLGASGSGKATTTVFAERARGWLPPEPHSTNATTKSSLPFVPGARRAGWGPPLEPETLRESLEEGIRRHAERCDAFAGFLTLADDARGWGAAAAEAQALARDEYARCPRVLFALRPADALFASSCSSGSSGSKSKGKSDGNVATAAVATASEAAEALSLGMLGPLVDVFVPLSSPPESLWSLQPPPRSRSRRSCYSPCDALFRWSAAAAAAVDAATTPLRLLRSGGGGGGAGSSSSSSSASSLGGFGISSLASLLAGPRGGPLAALSASFPLLPITGAAEGGGKKQEGEEGEGERKNENWASDVSCWSLPFHSSSSSRRRRRRPLLFEADGDLLSESVAVRGVLSSSSSSSSSSPRRQAAPLPATVALAELEAALASEGARAARRRLCCSRAPLHLPLPFPEGMAPVPRWCYERSRVTGGGGAGGDSSLFAGGAPALARLSSSRSLAAAAAGGAAELLASGKTPAAARSSSPSTKASRHASGLRSSRAIGGGGGTAIAPSLAPLLSSWGVDRDDAAEASAEVLASWRDEYRGSGSDGFLSGGGGGSGGDDSGDDDY